MSRRPDMADVRRVLSDHRAQTITGVVFVPNGEASHYDIDDGEVYVWVKMTVPATETPLYCRLGSIGAGEGRRQSAPEEPIQALEGIGIWAIPRLGVEVQVSIPDGDLTTDPVITNTMSPGRVPSELTDDTVIVVKSGGPLKLIALAGDLTIDAKSTASGNGRVILQGGSLDVARKTDAVQVSFPSGKFIDVSSGLPNPGFTLTGTITGGTSKVKA